MLVLKLSLRIYLHSEPGSKLFDTLSVMTLPPMFNILQGGIFEWEKIYKFLQYNFYSLFSSELRECGTILTIPDKKSDLSRNFPKKLKLEALEP